MGDDDVNAAPAPARRARCVTTACAAAAVDHRAVERAPPERRDLVEEPLAARWRRGRSGQSRRWTRIPSRRHHRASQKPNRRWSLQRRRRPSRRASLSEYMSRVRVALVPTVTSPSEPSPRKPFRPTPGAPREPMPPFWPCAPVAPFAPADPCAPVSPLAPGEPCVFQLRPHANRRDQPDHWWQPGSYLSGDAGDAAAYEAGF